MSQISGRCLCGAIRWASSGPILWMGHCHCDSCRRACSAPFTSFLSVPRDSMSWQGILAEYASSPGTTRGFCPGCGAQMHYQSERWPEETHLYAAALDDPTQYQPTAHFHWGERVPWVEIDDDLRKFEATAGG